MFSTMESSHHCRGLSCRSLLSRITQLSSRIPSAAQEAFVSVRRCSPRPLKFPIHCHFPNSFHSTHLVLPDDKTSKCRFTCGFSELCRMLGLKNKDSSSGWAVISKTLRALRIACGTNRGSFASMVPSKVYRKMGTTKKMTNNKEMTESLCR